MNEASLSGAILRMSFWLGVLLVVIFALAWLASRFGIGGARSGGAAAGVRVLARTAIDPRKSVLLLSVRGRVLVVGVTPAQITLLTELDGEEEAATPAAERGSFSTKLARMLTESGILPTAQ
jgi:flagellar biosynthetic protein FliO